MPQQIEIPAPSQGRRVRSYSGAEPTGPDAAALRVSSQRGAACPCGCCFTFEGADHMRKRFKIGDHVSWNSEVGHDSGRIIKVHSKDVDYKGHTHHATQDEPQYEIKSDKTDHIAMHTRAFLRG
jgi:hypothetical protein